MNTLIIGGSRGIGWELARIYVQHGDSVIVTGRKEPENPYNQITFISLNLSTKTYISDIENFIDKTGHIDRLIYAPGFYQEGAITDLTQDQILDMIQVCGTAFIFMVRAIINKQSKLGDCIVITSSSQWTPRKLEPIYNFAKAGIAHFAHALSLDGRINKVLVAGPTGTKTAFHNSRDVDMTTYHSPDWVAQQIFDYSQDNYHYKFIKILRDPASVEIAAQE